MGKIIGLLKKIEAPYVIMLCIYTVFIAYAFIAEPPIQVLRGFVRILTSQATLVTDLIAVGGLGATLFNSAIVGLVSVIMLKLANIRANGAIIAALWLTLGFTFFGKNLYNMIPLTVGVWLFSKYMKEPFANFTLVALLVASVSPTVSELSFMGVLSMPVEIILGILLGFLIGFIFPSISASTVKIHGGYDLYNMGFAGGIVCMVGYAVIRNFGIEMPLEEIYSYGYTVTIGIGLYFLSLCLVVCGLFLGDTKENLSAFRDITKRSGRLVSDFYFEHGNAVFLNMGLLGILSTSVTLVLGGDLNGMSVAGIITIMGFGGFGKHIVNVVPIMAGATIAALLNQQDPGHFSNIIPILFSTALAPLAGQYGIIWGVIAGFLHLTIAQHTSDLTGGMNLYANGFAAGFVAIFLIPIITALKKERVQ